MKTVRSVKVASRVLLAALCAAASLLVSCNSLDDDDETTQSLTLNKESLTITSALGGYTTATLTATLTGSSESLTWYTTDSDIISVSASGKEATLTCEGTAGTAKVGVYTSDGALEATCMVTVELSATPALPPTAVSVTADSETTAGFTLTWTDPEIASKVVIDVFETEDARTTANALAALSSSTEPTVYSTYSVALGTQTLTISDLLTDDEGKTYYYSAYGFINGKRSVAYVNGSATLVADSTAPRDVTGIALSEAAGDHELILTWTEPDDSDYTSVTITISPATDFAGNALDESVSTQTIAAGTTTATFSSLAAGTAHTFTFVTTDVNGNTQGDSNNTDNAGTTATFTTASDTTAPAAVTDVSATFTVNGNVTVTWTDPSDEDCKQVVVTAVCNTGGYTAPDAQTIAAGTATAAFTCDTDADYTFTVVSYDYDGNASDGTSATAEKPVVTAVTATQTTAYSGITISWTEPTLADDYTYAYKVSAYNDDTETAYATVASGTTSYTFSDELDFDTTYTYKVTTVVAETATPTNNATYVSSSTASAAVSKVTVILQNRYNSHYMLPVSTSSVTLSASSSNTDYSTTFIVRPALDGTETASNVEENDSFSLEATDASGGATGLYLYATSLSTSNTSWTTCSLALADSSSISDATTASFFLNGVQYASGNYTNSIRFTYSNGGCQLGDNSGSDGSSVYYRYSSGGNPGVSQAHWYFNATTE